MNMMKNANKRIIIYLVIVLSLLLFLIIETMVLRSRLEKRMQEKETADTAVTSAGEKEIITESSAPEETLEVSPAPYQSQGIVSSGDRALWNAAVDIYGRHADSKAAYEEMTSFLEEQGEDAGGTDTAFGEEFRRLFEYWDETDTESFVNQNGLPDGLPDDDSLCIVILGYALYPDGKMRDELILRLDEGLAAARKYPNAYVLVTGGGTAMGAPMIKEADRMADYLKDKGLEPSRIIVEDNSMTTAENAVLSEMILKTSYPQVEEIAIVTSDYHVPLGCQIFQGWFIMTGSKLKVVSNSACHPGNPTVFKLKDQVFWMEELTHYL